MSDKIKLGFKTLPVPHYYLSRSGVSAISVAIDFELSPIMTQIWQYAARLGKKSDALEDIISDLEKIANFAITERDRIIVERGGTVDYKAMVARFGEDDDPAPPLIPGFDVDGNMVRVIRCTKCGDQLQARTQSGWRIGISDKWEHQCGEGGEWYTANDFWPIGISAQATKPSTEDEIMGAEFDSLKPGDVIIGEGGMRQVTAVNQESRVITYAYFGANCPLSRTDFIRWCWRKVVTS